MPNKPASPTTNRGRRFANGRKSGVNCGKCYKAKGEKQLVLEIVTWDIAPNQEIAFESAFAEAQNILSSAH
jgi:hypothetical protein